MSLLLVTCVFTSCEKEEDLIPQDQLEETDKYSEAYHREVVDTYMMLFHLINTVVQEAITQPQLYFLSDEAMGDTRMGCPDAIVTGPAYPKLMTLDFDQCDNAGIRYDGTVMITFNAPLGDAAAAGPEIVILPFMNAMVNGYDINLNGQIQLEQTSGFEYDFMLVGGTVSSARNGVMTVLPDGTMGSFGTSFDPATDDVNDPTSFLDNPFSVGLKETTAVCTNRNGDVLASFCTSTDVDAPFTLEPMECSCPTDGLLNIADGACGDGGAVSSYDFGFIDRGSDPDCNNDVEELTLLEFISYEGEAITATDGVFAGMTSTVIGVVESNATTGSNESLQLTDTGDGAGSNGFFWTDPSESSCGNLNVGQDISNVIPTGEPWINEFHYDNERGDRNEAIEIAGPAGLDLTGYFIDLYNGSGTYNTIELSGVIPDENMGYGAVCFPFPTNGIQNGPSDGIALYRQNTVNVEFCVPPSL